VQAVVNEKINPARPESTTGWRVLLDLGSMTIGLHVVAGRRANLLAQSLGANVNAPEIALSVRL